MLLILSGTAFIKRLMQPPIQNKDVRNSTGGGFGSVAALSSALTLLSWSRVMVATAVSVTGVLPLPSGRWNRGRFQRYRWHAQAKP